MTLYGRRRSGIRLLPSVFGAPPDRNKLIRADALIRSPTVFETACLSRLPTADFINRNPLVFNPTISIEAFMAADFINRSPSTFDPTITAESLYASTHSLECNSATDGAQFGDQTEWDALTRCTWQLWFRASALPSGDVFGLVEKGWNIQVGRPAAVSINNLTFSNGGAGVHTSDAPIAAVDTWYHIVIVFNGTLGAGIDRVRFYVNGVDRARTGTGPSGTLASNSLQLTVGSDIASGATAYFDDVAMWLGMAATSTQVAELYNSGHIWDLSTASFGAPTHWFKFDNDYTDAGSNPITGSAVSTPAFNSSITAPP